MWIDVTDDGGWRIGVDAFLVHCFGEFESVTFIIQGGLQCPAAVLSVRGTEVPIIFPHLLPTSGCNMYLRADPSRIAAAPYTQGWLFRGDTPPDRLPGLFSGEEAKQWMSAEADRASVFAHSQLDLRMPADGGAPGHGFLRLLKCEDRLRFINFFFSPWAGMGDNR